MLQKRAVSANMVPTPGDVFVQMKRNMASIGISRLADVVVVENGLRLPAPR